MNDDLQVHDVMNRRPVTIGMDATLLEARRLFQSHQFHHLLVLEAGRCIGVVSDRDLLKNISPFIGSPFSERPQDVATLRRRIHQVMTRKLISIPSTAAVHEAARLMIERKVSCLPVIDGERDLVGIVTLRDLVRHTLHAPPATAAFPT